MRTLLVFLLMIILTPVSAQDTIVYSEGAQVSYHPYDIFIGGHLLIKKRRFEQGPLIEAGAIRTLFQARIYPRIGYQVGYHIVDRSVFRAGLLARPVLSLLHVNRDAKHGFSYFEELFLGGFAEYGKTHRFRFSAGFGPCLEQKWSQPKSGFNSWLSWNYFGELSWSHAF